MSDLLIDVNCQAIQWHCFIAYIFHFWLKELFIWLIKYISNACNEDIRTPCTSIVPVSIQLILDNYLPILA